ncbi:hypothetical protein H4R34_001163 [Dimargaris verticillata]|uniref:Nucleoporin Nup133/Nup155-like C-terminal domain-containing protein n=1 Tax=Dimargaris verticillata TaxID=2761393 RepID=A0A9W8BAD7_9FUNG|nr:hypothetical protein H4R34_001163 [Dimargaris verticillata]
MPISAPAQPRALGDVSSQVQDQRIYLKSASHAVVSGGLIPAPIASQVHTQLAQNAVTGCVHAQAGYAAVVTESYAYVWDYRQADRRAASGAKDGPQSAMPYYTFPVMTLSASSSNGQSRSFNTGAGNQAIYSPAATAAAQRVPLCSLVTPDRSTTAATQDVGLLLCTRDGQIRFWAHVAYGLTGSEAYSTAHIELAAGDNVHRLVACDPIGYLLATRQGALYKLILAGDSTGKPILTCTALTKPMGMLQRVTSSLFGYMSHMVDEAVQTQGDQHSVTANPKAVLAMVLGSTAEYRQSREFFVLTQRYLQKWSISKNYGDQFHLEVDAFATLAQTLAQRYSLDEADLAHLHLRLLDFQLTHDSRWTILASFCSEAQSRHLLTSYKIKFALFEVEPRDSPDHHGSQLEVVSVRVLNYSFTETPKTKCPRPTLLLPQGGPTLAVVFPQTVVLSTLIHGATFDEVLSFQDSRIVDTDVRGDIVAQRMLAYRSLSVAVPWLRDQDQVSRLSLLCLTSGVVDVYINLARIMQQTEAATRASLTSRGATASSVPLTAAEKREKQLAQTKSILEQAVFFGNATANPLRYSVDHIAVAILDRASLALSHDILSSQSPHFPQIMELRLQLQERLTRAETLAEFLEAHKLTSKLFIQTRYTLCWNAQKLTVALALWNYRNGLVQRDADITHPAVQLLTEAVDRMALKPAPPEASGAMDAGDPTEYVCDPLRRFFYFEIDAMEQLLVELYHAYTALTQSWSQSDRQGLYAYELNRMTMMALQTALFFEDDHQTQYVLDAPAGEESWFATSAILNLLQSLFGLTQRMIDELGRVYDTSRPTKTVRLVVPGASSMDDATPMPHAGYEGEQDVYESPRALWSILKGQLIYLADLVLNSYNRRLAFFQSRADYTTHQQTVATLHAQYAQARQEVIQPLVAMGKVDAGFELAEKYTGYAILVQLIFDHETSARNTRIEYYMDRFGRDFAHALYDYYVSHQQFHDLLKHGQVHTAILQEYLDAHPQLTFIAWLHEFHQQRFEAGATKLHSTYEEESGIATSKSILSLGKLALLTNYDLEDLEQDGALQPLEAFDDKLDVMGILNRQQELCWTAYSAANDGVPKADEEQVQVICQRLAPSLKERYPAFYKLFAHAVDQLRQGFKLATEDLVDFMTLKECSDDDQRMDFELALEVVSRSTQLPIKGFECALKSIWRRVFLHDDWKKINQTLYGTSDEELAQTLQNTTLFHTLLLARQNGLTKQFLVAPTEALYHKDHAYLKARLGRVATLPNGAKGFARDYEAENKELNGYTRQARLSTYYNEILRMVYQQVGGDALESDHDEATMVMPVDG